MKLQEKASLILVVMLILVLTLICLFVSIISLFSFSALEHEYVLVDVDPAVNRLQGEYTSISSITTDWGQWDDTYNFVNGNKPDLVLMDINIKGDIDGIETAKMIKKGFNIPVIYVTSHSDGPTLVRAKETQPDGFIVKPFDDNDLRVAIQLALKK